jgi:Exocyst complex subunit Sec15-like
MYLNYSSTVIEICSAVVNFITENVQFLQGTLDNESFLFLQLDRLLYEIFRVYHDEVEKALESYHPLQLALVEQNSNVLQLLTGFFKKTLERASANKYSNDFESLSHCEQIQYMCDEKILEKIKTKLGMFIENGLTSINWEPKELNKKCSDLGEDVINDLSVKLIKRLKTIGLVGNDEANSA